MRPPLSSSSSCSDAETDAEPHAEQDPSALHISFNEFRPRLVEYLEQQGAKGLASFLFSSLSSLVQRRKSSVGGA